MAYDIDNVGVATSGNAYRKGATALNITSATSVLSGALDLGLITEDGVEVSSETERTTISGWQSKGPVRDIINSGIVKYKWTCMENIEAVKSAYYGSEEIDGKREWDPTKQVRTEWVFDMFDEESANGSVPLERHHVLDGAITAIEPITYNGTTVIGYGFEVTAYRKDGRCADIYNGLYVPSP